jgi:hypothetical protein
MFRFVRFLALLASVAAVLPAQAQTKPTALPGMTWSSIAELPKFVGVWEITRGPGGRGAAAEPISLTPAYAAQQKAFLANRPEDNPQANCVPPGMPAIMTQPYPIEVLFTPGKVTILIEAYEQIRHIYTDGRKLPDDPDLTYNGTSVGHWEGDTLVVETAGFTKDTVLGPGMHHSEKMRITERMKLASPDLLQISATVQDPDALVKPFTRVTNYARHADWTLAEYVCQQNNRNSVDEKGKAGINLSR